MQLMSLKAVGGFLGLVGHSWTICGSKTAMKEKESVTEIENTYHSTEHAQKLSCTVCTVQKGGGGGRRKYVREKIGELHTYLHVDVSGKQ